MLRTPFDLQRLVIEIDDLAVLLRASGINAVADQLDHAVEMLSAVVGDRADSSPSSMVHDSGVALVSRERLWLLAKHGLKA